MKTFDKLRSEIEFYINTSVDYKFTIEVNPLFIDLLIMNLTNSVSKEKRKELNFNYENIRYYGIKLIPNENLTTDFKVNKLNEII